MKLPRSREATAVARALLHHPGSPHTLELFADREQVSTKTLQRQFLRETGIPFSTWRARARVAAAVEHLKRGQAIGETGRRVGYATPAGFTKAFRLRTGASPREYVLRSAQPHHTSAQSDPVRPDVVSPGPLPPPPPIPARSFWAKVNDHHELIWVYRGTSTLRIGEKEWSLRQGNAVWVPAGLTYGIDMAADALTLTVGRAYSRSSIKVENLIVFTFPAEAEALLLHTMISEFTLFRPGSHPGALTRRLFHEQFLVALPLPDQLTGALGDIAVALRRDPADRRSLADWAARFRTTTSRLSEDIRSQSGASFLQWRSHIIMDIARELLRAGDPPGEVSRKLA